MKRRCGAAFVLLLTSSGVLQAQYCCPPPCLPPPKACAFGGNVNLGLKFKCDYFNIGNCCANLFGFQSCPQGCCGGPGGCAGQCGPWYQYWPQEAHFQVPAPTGYPYWPTAMTLPNIPLTMPGGTGPALAPAVPPGVPPMDGPAVPPPGGVVPMMPPANGAPQPVMPPANGVAPAVPPMMPPAGPDAARAAAVGYWPVGYYYMTPPAYWYGR